MEEPVIIKHYGDGGVRTRFRGIEKDICPFLKKGSPCESPADPLWAMSCPSNYKLCRKYGELMKNGR